MGVEFIAIVHAVRSLINLHEVTIILRRNMIGNMLAMGAMTALANRIESAVEHINEPTA